MHSVGTEVVAEGIFLSEGADVLEDSKKALEVVKIKTAPSIYLDMSRARDYLIIPRRIPTADKLKPLSKRAAEEA